jgi:hypothetical protein
MRKSLGIVLIYLAAVLILISILIMFELIPLDFAYTIAAVGFACYIGGTFLTREGKLTTYKVAMIVVGALLIVYAIFRELT